MLRNVFRKKEDQRNRKEMLVDDSTFATPRLNFFKRVKRRIMTAIRRRPSAASQNLPSEILEDDCSIGSRIGWRREVESGAEDFDCSTAKTISKRSLLDQWSSESKLDDQSNLIEMLPMELLAHVASYLPVKDFNSLARTNRNNHGRLAKKFRKPLLVNLRLLDQEGEDRKMIVFEVFVEAKNGIYYCLLEECDTRGSEMSEEEKLAEVERFYRTQGKSECMCLVGSHFITFKFGLKEGLAAHLIFLHSQHIAIDCIFTINLDQQLMNVITDFLVDSRTRVNELQFSNDTIGERHLELIRSSHATSISIKFSRVMPGFISHASVRKLVSIQYEDGMMREGDLPMLAASSLLLTVAGITLDDIKTFLTQWIESMRNIERSFIHVKRRESISVWRSVLDSLDFSLVDIFLRNPLRPKDFTLRRKLDNQAVQFDFGHDYLYLYTRRY